MAEQDSIGGDEFYPPPKGKWAFIVNEKTGSWYCARAEEGASEGECPHDFLGVAGDDCIVKFLHDDVQELLRAWSIIRGEGAEGNLIEEVLTLLFFDAKEALESRVVDKNKAP